MIVAVDNSFSMRAGTRITDAKNGALEVLRQFRAGDRGQVISFASTAHCLPSRSRCAGAEAAVRRSSRGMDRVRTPKYRG